MARVVTLLSIFVIGWVCVEASMNVYIMSRISGNGHPLAAPSHQTPATNAGMMNQTTNGTSHFGLNLYNHNLRANGSIEEHLKSWLYRLRPK